MVRMGVTNIMIISIKLKTPESDEDSPRALPR
jgi:hypothetical protein